MCGICGYVGIEEEGLLESMTAALDHRGPDGFGYYRHENTGIGHRRLSIIDVEGGRQPMRNEDESLVLVCNGEIYNYRELRAELSDRGHRFRTHSDSEVVLHLYEDLGARCLDRLIGMFAFAIFDARRRRLFVARDRLGIKPLYYLELPGRFLFASEAKALLRYRGFQPTPNPEAIDDYLALRYVPGPACLWREVRKLPAGHSATFERGELRLERYWRPELSAGPFDGDGRAHLEEFAERFERSIRRRMISEVPLGAYLSAGVDSSTIVAAMARIVSKPIQTFTVGFPGDEELEHAALTARRLGCDHTEIPCHVADVSLLPEIVYHLDEPIGDPIVIPMYRLAREAKRKVTVVLSGEGADELLGGYLFHRALLTGARLSTILSPSLRRAMLHPALAVVPARLLDAVFDYPGSLGRRGKLKLLDFLDLVDPPRMADAYRHLISLFDSRDLGSLYTPEFRRRLGAPSRNGEEAAIVASPAPYLNRILHLQFPHWLPDDILTKQDKLSMASAIEARVPFLDHELVEFVLRLPPWEKIRRGRSKVILRRYAERVLPPEVTFRRKRAFYFPLEKCLAEPVFRDLVEDCLSERSIRDRGVLEPAAVARLRQSVHAGEFVLVKQIFSLVALELWFRHFVDRRGLR